MIFVAIYVEDTSHNNKGNFYLKIKSMLEILGAFSIHFVIIQINCNFIYKSSFHSV